MEGEQPTGSSPHQPRPKEKDAWDRFSSVSTFLASLVLGLIGLWFTHSYNMAETARKDASDNRDAQAKAHDGKMLEMQTVEKFLPHLIAGTDKEKKAALLTMSTLADPSLAAKLGDMLGIQQGVDEIMAKAASKEQLQNPPVVTQPGTEKTGWVYLGHYVADSHQWQSKYFSFSDSDTPDSLKDKQLAPRRETGDVNVRQDMPTPEGDFPKVINVLRTGTLVKVTDVREWDSSGFMWARISY